MKPEVIQNAVTPLKDLLPEVYGDALELCLLPITVMGYIPKMAKLGSVNLTVSRCFSVRF